MTGVFRLLSDFAQLLGGMSLWVKIGFLGQAAFTARFVVQWLASEKKRDSVVPVAFWWLSLTGGMILLAYAIHRQDPVIIVGQAMGLVVYVRNLMLMSRAKRRSHKRLRRNPDAATDAASTLPKPHRAKTSERPVPWA
jgi:lipid-A-disaccharide synthase-like uncharacterized protein